MIKRIHALMGAPRFWRRVALVWAIWLATVIVFKTFDQLVIIDGAKGALIATFFGVLATIVEFYRRDREADSKAEKGDSKW
jgi:hypothetical protein